MTRNILWALLIGVQILLLITVPSLLKQDAYTNCIQDNKVTNVAACQRTVGDEAHSISQRVTAGRRIVDQLLQRGALDEAIVAASDLSESAPENSEVSELLASTYMRRATQRLSKGDAAGAIADLSDTILYNPSLHAAYYERARLYEKEKKLDEATDDMKQAIELQSGNSTYRTYIAMLHKQRAQAFLDQKRLDLVAEEVAAGLHYDPTNQQLYLVRGNSLLSKGALDAASDDFTKVIQLNPQQFEAYFRRAQARFNGSQYTQAIADIDVVIKQIPKHVPSLILRAKAMEKLSNLDAALADYRLIILINPAHAEAQKEIARIEARATVTVAAPLPPERQAIKPEASSEPKAIERPYTLYANSDLARGDLRELKNISQEACMAACSADANCQAFVFDKWNKWCFLKSIIGTLRIDPKYISGTRAGSSIPAKSNAETVIERFRGKAFPYEGQNTRLASSLEECEQRCVSDQSCVAMTYFRKTKQCRLMENTGEYFSDKDADVGIKRQPAQ